jgi:hypothetical protein
MPPDQNENVRYVRSGRPPRYRKMRFDANAGFSRPPAPAARPAKWVVSVTPHGTFERTRPQRKTNVHATGSVGSQRRQQHFYGGLRRGHRLR